MSTRNCGKHPCKQQACYHGFAVGHIQRYGCEVIAIDRYDNAPAMQVAHRSYSVDMLDEKSLRSIIEKEKPNLINK